MTNYEAILITAKCEKCGKNHEFLIPTEKLIQCLVSKDKILLKKSENRLNDNN